MTPTNSAGLPVFAGPSTHIVTDVTEQRDLARDIACALEAENAQLVATIEKVRLYAQNLVGEWATGDVALDILAIFDADKHEVE